MANPKLYQAFPGFKWAVGIFAVYCSCEWVYVKSMCLIAIDTSVLSESLKPLVSMKNKN